jgi:hypothetical protein
MIRGFYRSAVDSFALLGARCSPFRGDPRKRARGLAAADRDRRRHSLGVGDVRGEMVSCIFGFRSA